MIWSRLIAPSAELKFKPRPTAPESEFFNHYSILTTFGTTQNFINESKRNKLIQAKNKGNNFFKSSTGCSGVCNDEVYGFWDESDAGFKQ